jgi:hypothetical protein
MEGFRWLLESARTYPIGALLVFLSLLKGHPNRISQSRLTHAQSKASYPQSKSHVLIYVAGAFDSRHLSARTTLRRSDKLA